MNINLPWKRTHTCGELRKDFIGTETALLGWVKKIRDLGGVFFLDLRDRYGFTQIVCESDAPESIKNIMKDIGREYIIGVKGVVRERPEGMRNKDMATGDIEVVISEVEVLNTAKTTPIIVDDSLSASEDLRLKYRYLDLRNPEMFKNMFIRHKMYQSTRNYFDDNSFIEIETPVLMKSTPEGARDFLVPSRVNKGSFFALPQSPQTYKQLLMVSGMDRYVQIAKCFRDEDLRADRQPEFTQIDVEMSFIDEEDIYSLIEGLMVKLMKDVLKTEIKTPFLRMDYAAAMETYGSDKPDLRWDVPIICLDGFASETDFIVFKNALDESKHIRGLAIPGGASLSRKEQDVFTGKARDLGLQGLFFAKVADGKITGSLAKQFTVEQTSELISEMKANDGDLIALAADTDNTLLPALGSLRLSFIEKLDLPAKGDYKFLWVTEFPLFMYNEEEKRYEAVHHPFTSPLEEDIPLLEKEPYKVRSRAYDIVLNGMEIGGGSIRIHRRELQEQMFQLLNISDEEANLKFGFLLEAFDYGAPPHGGIAMGFDRMAMIFAGKNSIRDVIAFPKTTTATSLMDGSPSDVSLQQLEELGLVLAKK